MSLTAAELAERRDLVPDLVAYDGHAPHLSPHVGFTASPLISSRWLNTDENGFRVTPHQSGRVTSDIEDLGLTGILLGSSLVFGVGASNDAATISGRLSQASGRWLNLGIRGASSFQEIQALLPFAFASQHIVHVSGANNLIIALQVEGKSRNPFHPTYFDEAFRQLSALPLVALWKRVGLRRRERLREVMNDVHPTRASGSEEPHLWDRLALAATRQTRDIAIAAALAGERYRFLLQPFASPLNRGHVSEEQRLLGLYDRRQGQQWLEAADFATANWTRYGELIRRGCAHVDVPFENLAAENLEGWCFLDRVHLRDHGYEQLASSISGPL